MAIYEYECEKCQKVHEVSQRMTDPKLKKCPVCKSTKITKLISQSSFALKGASVPQCGAMPGGGCSKPQCGSKS